MFEEIFLDPEEAKKYQNQHPCRCGAVADRVLSATNFQFAGAPGQSGSHDLDYPTLDKAVGRSAAKKWQSFYEGKAQRDKVRKEAGQFAVTQTADGIVPTSPEKLKAREQAIQAFNEAKKNPL
jgi:hypothetical protein